ncbi:phosphate ABC transporter substrate-binding protein PstS [Synechococcus sp. PCC 6312]|uniref:phosphate ABC transporter substrate-binding protein PstS n=1 Tax=Synechococcus sp. (strain ATCC 27167 / PCC 6312) TaxID=195253 RepID=UPI00029F4987|nr:phosphate ABC transporter substrate-binding protein PstS [Synechococcus sp. PCC 6312]AFY62605.1 phosphate ABC transporter substrate-binding protein, PhoT family [Synechococcus sp. PCC 6312]
MVAKIKRSRFLAGLAGVSVAFTVVACGGGQETTGSGDSTSPVSGQVALSGAGATFPAPLYQKWFADFNQKYPNITVAYQSVGSGAGVQQFTQGTVDFGASDVAMKDDEIAKVSQGVVMLPMTAGAIVMAYNLPEVKEPIKLSRQLLADILLGKVKKWNDPAVVKDNPGVTFPDKAIQVVYRSDGSGTTGVFTKHMAAASPEWKDKVGEGKTVQWPVGVGAKGNEGVTAQIQQTPGSIGYIEYGYAKQNGLQMAILQNKAGEFIEPTPEAFTETLATVELPENLRAFIPDPEGAKSYPLVSYTWILAYKEYSDPEKVKAFKAAMEYGLTTGQQDSAALGYIALPEPVVTRVKAALETIKP